MAQTICQLFLSFLVGISLFDPGISYAEDYKHLQKITPENKLTIKKKLEVNLGHLEHELILTQTQIQYQEENIVRKGCPGISL